MSFDDIRNSVTQEINADNQADSQNNQTARTEAMANFVKEILHEGFDSNGQKKSYADFHKEMKEAASELDSVTMKVFPEHLHIVGMSGDGKGLIMVKDKAQLQADGHYKLEDLMLIGDDGKLHSGKSLERSNVHNSFHPADTTSIDLKSAPSDTSHTTTAPNDAQTAPQTDSGANADTGHHHRHNGQHHRHDDGNNTGNGSNSDGTTKPGATTTDAPPNTSTAPATDATPAAPNASSPAPDASHAPDNNNDNSDDDGD